MTTSLGPSKEAIHNNLKNKDIEPLSLQPKLYKPNSVFFFGKRRGEHTNSPYLPGST